MRHFGNITSVIHAASILTLPKKEVILSLAFTDWVLTEAESYAF